MAYKSYRSARGLPGGRDALRMMQKMGMKVDEVEGVRQVVIRTASREIVIDSPSVTAITVQGQKMYQVAGGRVSESGAPATSKPVPAPAPAAPAIPDEDIQLVASQTGKSPEEARAALEQTQGDLAKAILKLRGGQ